MTVHTTHPSLQVTPKVAGLGIAAVLLTVGAGFATVSAFDDDALPEAPDSTLSQLVPTSGARDSWEGRIGPDAEVGGTRDSWMPPGTTDRELGQLGQRR